MVAPIVSELVLLSSLCGACNEKILEVKIRATYTTRTFSRNILASATRV